MTAQLPASEFADGSLPKPGDVVAGKYRIDEFIGRGGMGAVLAATHQVTGRRMALKWVLPDPGQDAEATHRIVREARAAARVRHPNVVDVYDVGEHDGSLFLVMELLEGETLHARLKADGALDPHTTLSLLLPALRAVEAAHRNHVIHRDLKPSNICLCHDSESTEVTPRVLDFGISKILSTSGDGERSLTRTGAVLGTPHYMAPEQLTGDDADESADIYALGVILYQCLTGRLPFQDRNYNALVLQIATATPASVLALAPQVPAALSVVVMSAMARDPGDRFANVTELVAALGPFCAGAPMRMSTHSRSWLWVIALAACLLAAVAAWMSQKPSARTEQIAAAPPRSIASPIAAPAASAAAPAATVGHVEPGVLMPAQPAADAPEQVLESPRERARERRRPRPQSERAASTAPATKQPVPITIEQF
jgi:serine/threonine protein kinase